MAGKADSKLVVYAALAGNIAVAVVKYGAAMLSGSAAMLSEAVHSTVDSGDQGLMLLGMHRAKRPADARHPFGHGLEIYFWGFVVAMVIFGVGACVSIWEGAQHIRHPEPTQDVWISYGVLLASAAFEGTSWYFGFREFRRAKSPRLGWVGAFRASKDPSVFTAVLEDTAALAGLLIAFVGISLDHWAGLVVAEGVASILIGLILALTAFTLAQETRSLLLGESVAQPVRRDIERIAGEDPVALRVHRVLTMHFGPEDVLVALSLDFPDDISAEAVEAGTARIAQAIRRRHPEVHHVLFEARDDSPAEAAPCQRPAIP